MKRKESKIYLLTILAVFLCLIFGLSACGGSSLSEEELSVNDNATITLHGLSEEDIQVSVSELKDLKSVTKKAEATRSNGQVISVKVTGPLLKTLLDKYGAEKGDFNTIRFYAKDGYSIAMPSDIIENDDIIIAYYDGGAPIGGEDGPVRVVVPGQRAMYWVRMLTQIDFESEASALTPSNLIFLDEALPQLSEESIKIGDQDVSVVKTQDLISAFADADDNTIYNVYMTASDGLSKNETKTNFIKEYIRVSGDGAPEFTGPALPEGMTVKGMVTLHYGDTAFLSLSQYAEAEEIAAGEKILFSDVIKKIGTMTSDTYRFIDKDGNSSQYSFDELSGASLIYGSSGVSFDPGNGKDGVISGLLKVEAVS